jgi:hypothetical protein
MSLVVRPASENPRLRISALITALKARQEAAAIEDLRTRLPLLDPDRHALDTAADTAFAQLACECPDPCACPPGGTS